MLRYNSFASIHLHQLKYEAVFANTGWTPGIGHGSLPSSRAGTSTSPGSRA